MFTARSTSTTARKISRVMNGRRTQNHARSYAFLSRASCGVLATTVCKLWRNFGRISPELQEILRAFVLRASSGVFASKRPRKISRVILGTSAKSYARVCAIFLADPRVTRGREPRTKSRVTHGSLPMNHARCCGRFLGLVPERTGLTPHARGIDSSRKAADLQTNGVDPAVGSASRRGWDRPECRVRPAMQGSPGNARHGVRYIELHTQCVPKVLNTIHGRLGHKSNLLREAGEFNSILPLREEPKNKENLPLIVMKVQRRHDVQASLKPSL